MHAAEHTHPHSHAHPHGGAHLLSAVQRKRLNVLFGLGLILTAVGLPFDLQKMLAHLLIASYLWLALALAGAVFLALHYVTKAGWSVVIKRVPEAMAATLPYAAVTFFGVLLLSHHWLYPWADHAAHAGGHGAHAFGAGKALWLTPGFFLVRAAGYLAVWTWLAWKLVQLSRRQDESHDPQENLRALRLSALFLVLFALTFSLASFDWFMALEPHWYSTIYGLYGFGGMFTGGLAAISVLTVWMRRRGAFGQAVAPDHLHDLGKLLLAFCTFWAYIWLSQYLLIWYSNIPEETVFYKSRHQGAYAVYEAVNLALNWILPFFLLLARAPKRAERALRAIAGLVLIGNWVDMVMRVLPAVAPADPWILPTHLGPALMLAPVMLLAVHATLHRAPLIAQGDPLLPESLHLHQ